MEELLATIASSDIRDYMQEAMNCYMASAYRGSIVMSYIALFDDILVKLAELSNVNAAAKTIHVEASKRKAHQDVYETYFDRSTHIQKPSVWVGRGLSYHAAYAQEQIRPPLRS